MQMGFQRVLVAVDEAPVAAHAAEVGIELASALGAALAFVHVVDPAGAAPPDSGIPAAELIAQAERDGKRLVAALRPRVPAGPTPLEFVSVGAAATEIVKAATGWNADLVVVGSHGRTGVSRALLGSVAEAVVRHAPCPVLVVRAKP